MGNFLISRWMAGSGSQPVSHRFSSDFRWTCNVFTIVTIILFGQLHGIAAPPNGENTLPLSPGVNSDSALPIRALILTGDQHPAHDWRKTTQALQEVLSTDKRFTVRVLERPELLAREIGKVDVIIQNYLPSSKPDPGEEMRSALEGMVSGGTGLVLIHYANGPFKDWPEYHGKMSRRNWVNDKSGHDPYQEFEVVMRDTTHPVARGLSSYQTTDELYFRQQGKEPIHVLAVGRSVVTKQEEPLAFVYQYGQGRVFQTLLGHNTASIRNAGTAELIRRGTAWTANRAPVVLNAPGRE
jgi:type 1 glutamine amidotransferase